MTSGGGVFVPMTALRRACCVTPNLRYDYGRREKSRAKIINGNGNKNKLNEYR